MSELKATTVYDAYWKAASNCDNSILVYLKYEADKVIAKKDKEIALLKEHICNGDVSRVTWIDACLDKDKEIDELKDKCQMHDFFWEGCGFAKRGFKNTITVSEAFDRLEAENAELKQKLAEKESWVKMLGEGEATLSLELEKTKQKLEDVNELIKTARQMLEDAKATHYTEMVDAGMRERRLRRALWIARARRAEARKNYWYARSCHEGDDFLVSIDGSPVKYIGCIKRTNYDWLLTWSEVERKCLKKAEEYK